MARKQLIDQIHKLSDTEHAEIFKILLQYNANYTQNNNGIFLNLTSVPDECISTLTDFVNFCIENKKDLDDYEKIYHECKINNTLPNEKDYNEQMVNDCVNKAKNNNNEDWDSFLSQSNKRKEIEGLMNDIWSSKEKKKSTTKFTSAKKKYSKKFIDKKIDNEQSNHLDYENYLIQ